MKDRAPGDRGGVDSNITGELVREKERLTYAGSGRLITERDIPLVILGGCLGDEALSKLLPLHVLAWRDTPPEACERFIESNVNTVEATEGEGCVDSVIS